MILNHGNGEIPWQNLVKKVRAGKSLKPKRWKNNARVAVALSFDSDHETTTLRWGDGSPGKLSQGEYGSRAAMPRIRGVLRENNVSASFLCQQLWLNYTQMNSAIW